MSSVVVIGAGVGGLSTAIRAAQHGHAVRVIEARSTAGGLAASVNYDGFRFDAGPYILLDYPGLEWAFSQLGIDMDDSLVLHRIEEVYSVDLGGERTIRFFDDRESTIHELETEWPASGDAYRDLVESGIGIHERIRPLQWTPNPGLFDVFKSGAWRDVPFLLRSLETILDRTGLPTPIKRAISIWTYVAGQSVDAAPSPLALVPALIHHVGAYYPEGGISTVPEVLTKRANNLDISLSYDTEVHRIRVEHGATVSVELTDGREIPADAVVSNYSAVGTYLELLDETPPTVENSLRNLPLQSPGVCGYMKVKGDLEPPYLRFRVGVDGEPCRLFIQPSLLDPTRGRSDWVPARLLGPIGYDDAAAMTQAEQRAYLDMLLAEDWWHEFVDDWKLLETRTVDDWGTQFYLYQNSMNPVMTGKFMRRGRINHRSPYVDDLYLTGSSTHPVSG